MLRRRILASAMASVMALSSVAVVANAEETAVKAVKTKADLDAYVKSFEAFRSNGIYDYGSVSGENFLGAIEFADNVLADSRATVDDYTAAYDMLKAVYDNLKIYTAEELKALVAANKSIYDTDNILNEELGDLIYSEDSFTGFVSAYDYAESIATSSDSRLISDAYEELVRAKGALSANTVVTKSQFRTVLKNYETMLTKLYAYDSWRRGEFAGWVTLNSGNYWIISNGELTQDYATVWNFITGSGAYVAEPHDWEVVVSKGDAATVEAYINEQYDAFDAIKTANKTTNDTIVDAYKAAQDALAVYGAWTVDNTTRATKASVTKLLNEYHSEMVAKYKATSAADLYFLINGKQPDADWTDSDNYYYGASLKNETTKTSIPVDEDGFYDVDGTKTQSVAKSIDILKYIKVTSEDATDADVAAALEIAENYIAENYGTNNDVFGLDEIGTVTTAQGSVAEWTIVYRNLLYTLSDTFKGDADVTYTKRDVTELINKAYDLAEATGDAAIFNDLHMALVTARQNALDWVAAANKDKTYKDGKEINGADSTATYGTLYTAYKALNDELAKYPYSYGDVYNKIAEVEDMIDSGDLTANDTLTAALTNTAYTLSTVIATDPENDAFTSDREFNAFNRVYAYADGNNDFEQALVDAYNALLAAVKAQTEVTVKLGDVDGNGTVNAFDASALLKAIVAGTEVAKEAGDYDANGVVNALDASAILKAIVAGTIA